MAFAGIGLHMMIAMGWTVLFFLAARQFEVLRRPAIAAAVGYGILVWILTGGTPLLQSARSAVTGFTRIARVAGTQTAMTATRTTVAVTPA